MSIVFFGTPWFSVPALAELLKAKEDVRLVITQSDKVGGRGHKIISPPIKTFALEKGLTVLQPDNIRSEDFIKIVRETQPEFIVVVAYGKILPVELLNMPLKGCINVHASLLPKYRGAAPIQWAIINGETVTGVTTMMMDEGLDTGDILMQKKVPIKEEDNTLSLSERLANEGANLLIETISGIRKGTIIPTPQEGEPTYAPIIKKEDGKINWRLSAREIHNRVRGLYPWPSAFTYLKGKLLKILKTEVFEGFGEPGTIVRKGNRELIVGTGKGLLGLLELQIEGKKSVTVREFLNGVGRNLKTGDRFSNGKVDESHSA